MCGKCVYLYFVGFCTSLFTDQIAFFELTVDTVNIHLLKLSSVGSILVFLG